MPLRGRDVQAIIKARGDARGALYCLQMIADEQQQLRKMIMECASAIDQLAELATTAAIAVDGAAPVDGRGRKPLAQAIHSAMGHDIDAPDINPHDQHKDEGVDTDPDRRADP